MVDIRLGCLVMGNMVNSHLAVCGWFIRGGPNGSFFFIVTGTSAVVGRKQGAEVARDSRISRLAAMGPIIAGAWPSYPETQP